MTGSGLKRRHDETDPPPPGRQAPPRVSVAGRDLAGRADPPPRRQPERTAPLGEVHERPEAHAPWHCHAAFERRRDALVFLDTTVVTPGGESTAASAAPPKRSETPERQDEPPGSSQPRKPRRRVTHDIDETRSGDGIRWSLCGVFLYDEKQIVQGDEPATCGKCQRYTTATSYLKRREAMKAAKKRPDRTS